MQHAFYVDGRSLSDPATYRAVAEAAGLDSDAVVAAFESPEARAAAAGRLPPRGANWVSPASPPCWPSRATHVAPLAYGHATADEVDQRLASYAATLTS